MKIFFFWAFTITGCISISAFDSFLSMPVGITSSAIGLKICVIAAGIKRVTHQLRTKTWSNSIVGKKQIKWHEGLNF